MLKELLTANSKLKYQIKHLREVCFHCVLFLLHCNFQSISHEELVRMKYMTNVLRVVNGIFTYAIRSLYPLCPELNSTVQYSGSKFGDYKCMAAMPIAQVSFYVTIFHYLLSFVLTKLLKSQGCVRPPREVAQEIVSNLKFYEPFIDKV